MSFRATWVKACGPDALFGGATRKHNQQKMHGEKRWSARFIMHPYGGKLLKDIAVKRVKRKT